jgi:hypothetical protein
MQQNKFIVIVGIPRNVMPLLENDILESSGVTGISDTNRTDKSGRWNILVKEFEFKSICKRLSTKLQVWVRELPHEIQANIPDSFPPPKVYQKNDEYDDDNDGSSYGQASYMSSCAQSCASFDDNDDEDPHYNPPGVQRHTSYATAVSGNGYGSSRIPTQEPVIPQQEPRRYHRAAPGQDSEPQNPTQRSTDSFDSY